MQKKYYVFMYRTDGSMKSISAQYWQRIVQGQQPLPQLVNQQLKFAEAQILTSDHKTEALHCFKLWVVSTNKQGFVIRKDWQHMPFSRLSVAIQEAFSLETPLRANPVSDYLDEVCGNDVATSERYCEQGSEVDLAPPDNGKLIESS